MDYSDLLLFELQAKGCGNLVSSCCGAPTTHVKSEDVGGGKFITWRRCRKCQKDETFQDLVREDEYLNIKRTKLIDRMLDDNR